jgi:hypothetical protein
MWAYRKPLAEWAIQKYLQTKGIALSMNIDVFSLNEFRVLDVVIEDTIRIPHIYIQRDTEDSRFMSLRTLDIHIFSIDIPKVQKLMTAFPSTPSEETPATTFSTLLDSCQMAQKARLNLKLDTINYNTATLPLGLHLEHAENEKHLGVTFSGATSKLQNDAAISIGPTSYEGQLQLRCSKESISIQGDPLILKNKNFIFKQPYFKINTVNLKLNKFSIEISPNNTAFFSLPLSFAIDASTHDSKYKINWPQSVLTGKWFLDGSEENSLNFSAQNVQIFDPQVVDLKNIKLSLTTSSQNLQSYSGDFLVKGLTYKNSLQKPLIQDLKAKGIYKTLENGHSVDFEITDSANILHLKKLKATLLPDNIQLVLPKNSVEMQLKDQITDLFPSTQNIIKMINGTIKASGHIRYIKSILSGNLNIEGQKIYADTEYGDVSNLNFHHDINSFKKFSSSPKRTLSMDKLRVGKAIKNIVLTYQVLGREKIHAEALHLEYEDAQIQAVDFFLNPMEKTVNNFVASVKNLKLQTLLAIGLGENIHAEGKLNGSIELNFVEKVPVASGRLIAEGPGTIRFRKPGQAQQAAIQLSDNPLDILNGYLYNFNYTDLAVDIRSNEHYKMNMIVSTLGYNPEYVKGKPLKLKVSFEQNILAALQYMMLSYDLPNKLKERIEKAGEK